MKQFNVEDIVLESVTLTDASIENIDEITVEDLKLSNVRFAIGFEHGVNKEQERVMVSLIAKIECLDENQNELNVRANFKTQFIFKVTNLGDFVEDREGGKIEITGEELAGSLVNIVYSTSRGIIYTRCLGTIMGSIILPVISVKRLLEIAFLKLIEEEKNEEAEKK